MNIFSNSKDIKFVSDFLHLQLLLNVWQFCDFSENKNCKTYLGSALPPGGRNWHLIYPN